MFPYGTDKGYFRPIAQTRPEYEDKNVNAQTAPEQRMVYTVIIADTANGQRSVLCYTLTRKEAEEIVRGLAEQHPDLRFAIVADEETP